MVKLGAHAVAWTALPLLICGIVSCTRLKPADSAIVQAHPTAEFSAEPDIQFSEPADEDSFVTGELISPGDAITKYFAGFPKGDKENVPTWDGLEQSLREKYKGIMVEAGAFKNLSSFDVKFQYDYDKISFSTTFDIVKQDQSRVGYIDLSQVSGLFREARIPATFTTSYEGSYSFGCANPSELESISTEQAMERNGFYAVDHLAVVFTARGSSGSRSGDTTIPRAFIYGFPVQTLVLGSLELFARPVTIDYSDRVEYVMTGGDGQGNFAMADIKKKAFAFDKAHKLTCTGQFAATHPEARGSLLVRVDSEEAEKPGEAQLGVEGTLRFPTLTLGDSVPLSDAALSFDGSPDSAQLEATVRLADLKKIAPEAVPSEPGAADTERLTGVYDFATSRFAGSVGKAPLQVAASLAAPATIRPAAASARLYSLLAVFPDYTDRTCEVTDEAPDYPSALPASNGLDFGDVQSVLRWDPPAESLRPSSWSAPSREDENEVWTRKDLQPQEPAPRQGKDEDYGFNEGESPVWGDEGGGYPMGDEGGADSWGRGFYAIGCSYQPRFYLLIVAYWEGRTHTYSGPGVDQTYQYKLFTVGLDGKLIHQQDLFSGGSSQNMSEYPEAEDTQESGGSLVLQPDLSFSIGAASYRVDEDGQVSEAN